jgi:hypothetical protein
MSKSLHNRIVIIRRSVQKLATHRRRPKNVLPLTCIRVNVLSKCRQWISLWVPETATYTSRIRMSPGESQEAKGRDGRNKSSTNA